MMMSMMNRRSDDDGWEAAAVIITFVVLVWIPGGAAQGGATGNGQDNGYMDAKLTPSMGIIIVALIATMFFVGIFSLYIRHCTDGAGGGSIRGLVAVAARSRRARGVEPEALHAMPTFAYAEVKGLKIGKGALECAVCLNEFDDQETLRLLPKCDHVFHADCIDAWLASHTTCPVCRSNLVAAPTPVVDDTTVTDAAADQASGTEDQPEDAADQPNDVVVVQVGPTTTTTIPTQEEAQAAQARPTLPRRPPPARTWSMKKPRFRSMFPRSHSTGHSLVHPGENYDRFTLRLPENVRKDLMKRSLSRAATFVLPRETSSRLGYRTAGEGSSRGKPNRRMERLDLSANSDRWAFFSRALSSKSPKVAADGAGPSALKAPLRISETARLPV